MDASYGSSFAPADIIPPRDPEKADIRIVELAAKDVCGICNNGSIK